MCRYSLYAAAADTVSSADDFFSLFYAMNRNQSWKKKGIYFTFLITENTRALFLIKNLLVESVNLFWLEKYVNFVNLKTLKCCFLFIYINNCDGCNKYTLQITE